MKRAIIGILAFLMIMVTGCEKANDFAEPSSYNSAQGEWELVYEAEGNEHYHGLCFTDENNGWIVGDSGRILRTDDGGHSWRNQKNGTASDLHCIYFANDQRGWIAGSNNTIGIITDGGASWTWQQPEGKSQRLFMDMSFVDEQIGWIVDNYGGILHTEDGGATWVSQDSGTDNALTSVHFLDARKGWATVTNRTVLITADGGGSWTVNRISLSLPSGTLFEDVFFIDSENGWIATTTVASSDSRVDSSPLLHTTDGGESWFIQGSLPDKWLRRVRLADKDMGWLIGMESLFYTEDGGDSWSSQLNSGGDPFVDICLVDDLHSWVLSYTGKVYKFARGVTASEP